MITGALILTAIWVILAIAYPWYIHEPLQSMLGQNAARLGETGDYLAGWFTPLAFSWFIVTVFLQRNELKHQREELKMMRQEYSQSRIAAENQVQQLASSSLTAKQEILMQMLAQSNYSLSYNCEKIVLSVQELTGKPEANHVNNYKNQYGIIDAQVRLAVEILNDMVR